MNLKDFIHLCRKQLTVFGEDLDWDDWRWHSAGVAFTKLGKRGRNSKSSDALDGKYIDFAKAYLRYQQGHKPTMAKNEHKALRVLERALIQIQKTGAVCGITVRVLDEAAQIARTHFCPQGAYHCGNELMRLAEFVSEKNLLRHDLRKWKSPISKPKDIRIRTGSKAKEIREKKLPSNEAIFAIAEIFSKSPVAPYDIFTSSICAMIMCAPSRIGEILNMGIDCELEELDSNGNKRYGWRFKSGKGFGWTIKWIPTNMVEIGKEAIRRIRNLTDEPRRIAEWIESNPDEPYRHEDSPDVPDDFPLSVFDACRYLGVPSDDGKRCKLELHSRGLSQVDGSYTIRKLWNTQMMRQPKTFPWFSDKKELLFSNALFSLQYRQLVLDQKTSPLVLWAPTADTFNEDLKTFCKAVNLRPSIFDRHNFKARDGSSLKMTSHQPRHLLNTLANRGGLSQEHIALWSGRADVRQNRVYDHVSEFEMVAQIKSLDTNLTLFGPGGQVTQHLPITIQEFNLTEPGAMHVTEFGICVHDYAMSPCEKFRDCLGCEEQVCIKGDAERLERIKARMDMVEKNYVQAEADIEQGFEGADTWYTYHRDTFERLRQLVEILESPQVPDGALIKLRDGKEFSHLGRALAARSCPALVSDTSSSVPANGLPLFQGFYIGKAP